MFGKTYNTVGSTDSNFIIKTKGDLKVQWGGKYIDIIKNGKIASPSPNILKEVQVEDQITEDGLYLVSDTQEIIAQVNNTKVNLSNSSGATYISFLQEQPDITSDQKYTALSNIGFYYESLEDIQKAKISAGLVYSVKEGKIYVIKNSNISEYTFDTTENNDIKDVFDKIAVGELRIYKQLEYTQISSNDIEVFINNRKILTLSNQIDCYTDINLSDDSYIQSKLATPDEGFGYINLIIHHIQKQIQ